MVARRGTAAGDGERVSSDGRRLDGGKHGWWRLLVQHQGRQRLPRDRRGRVGRRTRAGRAPSGRRRLAEREMQAMGKMTMAIFFCYPIYYGLLMVLFLYGLFMGLKPANSWA